MDADAVLALVVFKQKFSEKIGAGRKQMLVSISDRAGFYGKEESNIDHNGVLMILFFFLANTQKQVGFLWNRQRELNFTHFLSNQTTAAMKQARDNQRTHLRHSGKINYKKRTQIVASSSWR